MNQKISRKNGCIDQCGYYELNGKRWLTVVHRHGRFCGRSLDVLKYQHENLNGVYGKEGKAFYEHLLPTNYISFGSRKRLRKINQSFLISLQYCLSPTSRVVCSPIGTNVSCLDTVLIIATFRVLPALQSVKYSSRHRAIHIYKDFTSLHVLKDRT